MSWVTNITNQSQYIDMLKVHLARLPEAERQDIIRDHEEFFRDAIASGRTEADVIGSLGDPKQLAKTLIAESRLVASENAFSGRAASGDSRESGSSTDLAKGTQAPGQAASFTTQMSATLRAFFAIITLAPFNLIFVLGPFLFVLGCLFAGWACGTASLVSGLGVIFFVFSELTAVDASVWAHVATICLGFAILMFSSAFLGLMTLVSSWVARLSVRYLRWNLDLITQRKNA